jgi:hypothetical protein
MSEHRFDELAKAMAEGISRREALRRLGKVLAGSALTFLSIGTAWGRPSKVSGYRCTSDACPSGHRYSRQGDTQAQAYEKTVAYCYEREGNDSCCTQHVFCTPNQVT